MRIFVDFQPIDDCKNPESYGEICVQCNQCGRFDREDEEGNNECTDDHDLPDH